ncbi:MAG: hypothetical protein LBI16_03955 [Burkholderiales bacterium]|jgi:uncharacterized membrane protein|nr:hypothetical protein [Burkholderiales bacterium]
MVDALSPKAQDERAREITTIIYALYALGLLTGLTTIVAIVMNYVKKSDVKGTLYESHFRWQIRTFWFSLLWVFLMFLSKWPMVLVLGLMLVGGKGALFLLMMALYMVGGLVLIVWYISRIVRGWSRLEKRKPMYARFSQTVEDILAERTRTTND